MRCDAAAKAIWGLIGDRCRPLLQLWYSPEYPICVTSTTPQHTHTTLEIYFNILHKNTVTIFTVHSGFAQRMYTIALQHGISSSSEHSSMLQNMLSCSRAGFFNTHLQFTEQGLHKQEQQRGCSAISECSIEKHQESAPHCCCKCPGWLSTSPHHAAGVWWLGLGLTIRSGLLVLLPKPATLNNINIINNKQFQLHIRKT